MEKTLAIWLGREKERLKIQNTHVTQEKMLQLNFDKTISEIERIISMYSKFSYCNKNNVIA